MARDAAFGILHLHKEQVIHRDIATRNILVGQNYEVYVSDFGLARVKESEEAGTTQQSFGPVGWMAPEALQNRQYSESTDAFSFGVMLWEMMARRRPWTGVEVAQIVTAVVSNTRLKIPSDCDPVFRRLMKQCWRHNPAQRPSFDRIVITLGEYYQTLKKIHHDMDETDCAEFSDDSETEDVTEEGRSSHHAQSSSASWEQRRLKDEVRTFLQQLIVERGGECEFPYVEIAYESAMQDLRRHYSNDTSSISVAASTGGIPLNHAFPVIPTTTTTTTTNDAHMRSPSFREPQRPVLASTPSSTYMTLRPHQVNKIKEEMREEEMKKQMPPPRPLRVKKEAKDSYDELEEDQGGAKEEEKDVWMDPDEFPVAEAKAKETNADDEDKDDDEDDDSGTTPVSYASLVVTTSSS